MDKYPMGPYSLLLDGFNIDSTVFGPTLYVPTVFTPNFDGINDLFYPLGSGIDKISIVIFGALESNKNGKEVYIYGKDEIYGAWWGVDLNGNLCSEGSYPYRIKYLTITGEEHIVRGIVKLYRN